jgi:hypothetical protein
MPSVPSGPVCWHDSDPARSYRQRDSSDAGSVVTGPAGREECAAELDVYGVPMAGVSDIKPIGPDAVVTPGLRQFERIADLSAGIEGLEFRGEDLHGQGPEPRRQQD